MNRRNLFQAIAGMRSFTSLAVPDFDVRTQKAQPGWRTFDITTRVEVLSPVGRTRVWLPRPLPLDTPYQRMLSFTVDCPKGTARMVAGGSRGEALTMVEAEFEPGVRPLLTTHTRVATRERTVDLAAPESGYTLPEGERELWLRPTKYVPTDGLVHQRALEITAGSQSEREKAEAIYRWIVDNTHRNPSTRGCGRGDIRLMLENGDLGGKCADINGLFVGLARAAGLPARDVYGLRVGQSRLGYGSLGVASEDVSGAQHCRAEVWLEPFGWVPVDPADVRKVMLEEPPGALPANGELVQAARARLFGSWEMNWVAYNYAQDVVLPGSDGPPLPFLMYPQAETAAGRLDSLDPESFRYTITAHEVEETA